MKTEHLQATTKCTRKLFWLLSCCLYTCQAPVKIIKNSVLVEKVKECKNTIKGKKE